MLATAKLLTISGTMFIDGSAIISNSSPAQYNGQGTLYLSGTFRMPAGSRMCASLSGSNCDIAGWNPNTALSPERIAALPADERGRWETYIAGAALTAIWAGGMSAP